MIAYVETNPCRQAPLNSWSGNGVAHHPSVVAQSRAELLCVAELMHRIGNDFTKVVAFANMVASRTPESEANRALHQFANLVIAIAETNQILRPPSADEPADLTDVVAGLCRSVDGAADFGCQRIELLLNYDRPISMGSWRCWIASLIVAELLNNAYRHAFASVSGRISVRLNESSGCVRCEVSNDGEADPMAKPGLGTQLIDALASRLNGSIERRFSWSGADVVLSFPKDDAALSSNLKNVGTLAQSSFAW